LSGPFQPLITTSLIQAAVNAESSRRPPWPAVGRELVWYARIEADRRDRLAEPQRRNAAMSLTRVQFFSISLDGFGTGEGLSREAPFGHAGERLHEWLLATRWWHERAGEPGGTGGVDDAFVRLHEYGIGAEIMGAGKFGFPGWHEDPDWKGWWGNNPPLHTPVFVLTHHPRPSLEMDGGTTFHFLDASPADALARAREAAGGLDVRIGGGPTVIRDFLADGLIDHMHIVVVPILLGKGVRLWDGLEGIEKDYSVEGTSAPSGVTHLTFTRRGV
jgi:dihydrofolate reductase